MNVILGRQKPVPHIKYGFTNMQRLSSSIKKATATVIVAAASFYPLLASAQSVSDARADIRGTYDFELTSMTFDEQAKRAPSISALWDRYTKNTEVYADALRSELRTPGNRELLYCDGGMLLLNKSKNQEDQGLGLASLGKCSLAEIQQTPYFYTLHSIAMRGIDTFDLQLRMLSKPKYSVFIVQHALSLGQDYAFLYPLLVVDETVYVPKLLKRLSEEQDPIAQKSLVRALWYAATADGETAIRKLASESGASSPAKEDARKFIENLNAVRQWKPNDATLKRVSAAVEVTSKTTESELRAKRRTRMRSISDEALYDLEAYTALIYRALSRN
jgi:hypothetical protein